MHINLIIIWQEFIISTSIPFFVAAVYQDDDTLEDDSYIKIHSRVNNLHQFLWILWPLDKTMISPVFDLTDGRETLEKGELCDVFLNFANNYIWGEALQEIPWERTLKDGTLPTEDQEHFAYFQWLSHGNTHLEKRSLTTHDPRSQHNQVLLSCAAWCC